jgi:hypothetical protein
VGLWVLEIGTWEERDRSSSYLSHRNRCMTFCEGVVLIALKLLLTLGEPTMQHKALELRHATGYQGSTTG